MKPKEKAKDLISIYIDENMTGIELNRYQAKNCALICVNEMIDYGYVRIAYWLEVRQEIEKL